MSALAQIRFEEEPEPEIHPCEYAGLELECAASEAFAGATLAAAIRIVLRESRLSMAQLARKTSAKVSTLYRCASGAPCRESTMSRFLIHLALFRAQDSRHG